MEATDRPSPNDPGGTKKRIVQVATVLFSERSYLGVSMNDIAERLGITKPALYYHFPSKRDLYAEVLEDVIVGLRAVIAEAAQQEAPEVRLHKLVRDYLTFGMRQRNLVNALVVKLAPDDADLRTRILRSRKELADRVEPIVRETIDSRVPPAQADARSLTEMLVALMDGLLVEYAFLGSAVDAEGVADRVLAILGLDVPPSGL